MKHLHNYLILILAMIVCPVYAQKYVLTSVSQKGSSHFDTDAKEIVFGTTAAHKTVTATTNLNISAVSNAGWCTVATSGKEIKVSVTANPDKGERTAVVRLQVKDGLSKDIKVRQFGSTPAVYATPQELTAVDTDEISFEVASSIAPEFTCPEWITPAGPAAAIGTNVYKFKLSAMTEASRTGYITVGGNGAEPVRVKVIQLTEQYPTFAVISDVHFGNAMGEGPMVKVPRALKNLSSYKKLDAIFVVGDLADSGKPEQYQQLVEVFNNPANYSNPIERKIFMLGNHDNYSSSTNYVQGLKPMNGGNPYPYDQYIVIKGYPFITISDRGSANCDDNDLNDGETSYPKAVRDTLARWLERASKECPGKPIFVFTHVPPKYTCYSSWPGEGTENYPTWAMKTLNPILNKYPQAVVFSGHSHFPLADPRSIHQGVDPNSDKQNFFTAINTGSTTYTEIESAVDEGIHPKGYDNVTEGLIVSVQPSGNVLVQRYDTERNEEIEANDPWVLKAPFDGTKFEYADVRDKYDNNVNNLKLRDGLPVPEFPGDAKIELRNTPTGFIATFPQAKNNDIVFRYLVRAINDKGYADKTVWAFSGYFLNSATPNQVEAEVSDLEEGKQYTVSVTAYDAYGNSSSTIVSGPIIIGKSTNPEDMPPARFGSWDFKDKADPLKCVEGTAQLVPANVTYTGVITMQNTIDDAGITYTESGDNNLSALLVPQASTFKVVTGKPLSSYTIMYDVRIADALSWHTLLQTNLKNDDDADFCIDRGNRRVGLFHSDFGYAGQVPLNEWHRIVLRVDNGVPSTYIDGEKVLQGTGTANGRWTIQDDGFFIFCDNDGEDSDIDVAAFSIWDSALSDMQICNLGGYATPGGDAQEVPASIGEWNFAGSNPLDNSNGTEVELLPGTVSDNGEISMKGSIDEAGIYYIDDPGIQGKVIRVPKNSALKLSVDKSMDNYTLSYKIRLPRLESYNCLLQCTPDNSDDGDIFVKSDGTIGLATNDWGYAGNLSANTWYHFVFTVKDGVPSSYIDGEELLKGSGVAENRYVISEEGAYLFCDNDGEMGDVDVAGLRFWNVALSSEQIKQLEAEEASSGKLYADVKEINMREGNEFSIRVTSTVEPTFDLPGWIQLKRPVPSIGSSKYVFHVDSMTEVGTRTAEVTIKGPDACGLAPYVFTVTQTYSGADVPQAKATWNFNNPSSLLDCENPEAAFMQAATIGDNSVSLVDSYDDAGITAIAGPTDENKAIRVPAGSALNIQFDAESEERIANYAIMYDIRVPEKIGWCGLLQTNLSNNDDADFFINGSYSTIGSGSNGWHYDGKVYANRWYRIVLNLVDGVPSAYINGELVTASESAHERWALDPLGCLLFCDNDGEKTDIDVAAISYWDKGLTSTQIAKLGSVDYPYIFTDNEKVELEDGTKDFTITIKSSVVPKFETSEWIRPVSVSPAAGEHIYQFRADDMQEEGTREGTVTITSADATGACEPVVIKVVQSHYAGGVPTPTAAWDFSDESDLLKAGAGTAVLLPYSVSDNGSIERLESAAGLDITPIEGPNAGSKAVTLGKNAAFLMEPNEGRAFSSYTLMMDIRRNTEEWCSLMQTNPENSEDGEIFIQPSGDIGLGGHIPYVNKIETSQWHRIVVVVKDNVPAIYVDGMLATAASSAFDRYTIAEQGAFLFCDNDGEMSPIDISAIRFWIGPLSAGQVEALGKAAE